MIEYNVDDVVLNKIATIQRCLKRIDDEYVSADDFKNNFTRQDSVILNLQRASEASIDLANFVIRQRQLGIPQSSRDTFSLLMAEGVISEPIGNSMQAMVGLRNIAVHDYQTLNIDIVISVITTHVADFIKYSREITQSQTSMT